MKLWQGTPILISSVVIIFALLGPCTTWANASGLLSSGNMITSPSKGALSSYDPTYGHNNWTVSPTEGAESQMMMPFHELSTAVAVLVAIAVIAGAVRYKRRNPIIIDD
jgi:cytochrome b